MKTIRSIRSRLSVLAAMLVGVLAVVLGDWRDRARRVSRGLPEHASPIERAIRARAFGVPMLIPSKGRTGTLAISDLQAVTFQSANAFGLNMIADVFGRDLLVHQTIMADLVGWFAEVSADTQRIQGSSDSSRMSEVDEFGRAPTRKITGGTTVGFPLRMYQYNIGWTRKYLQNHTPAELANQFVGAKKAQVQEVSRQLKRALYLSANYTFQDFLVNKVDLSVKRLLNADSAPIPDGPNGEVFDATTHTHYDAINGLTAAALLASINDVIEHGFGGKVVVVINQANEAAVRALAGFTAYLDPRIQLGTGQVAEKRLDITRIDNRAIGIFGAAEVWVKPWGIASYTMTFDTGTANKPVVIRTRDGKAPTLVIAAEIDAYPLHAQFMESEFGVGVWNRANGAVLYFGGGSYVDPTIP